MYGRIDKKTSGNKPLYEIKDIDGCPMLYFKGRPAHEHDWKSERREAYRVSFDPSGAPRYTRTSLVGPPRMWASARGEPPRGSETPALDAYVKRIGAERKNFRTFIVSERTESRYRFDKYTIKLHEDGTVTVHAPHGQQVPDGLAPSESEAKAIADELKKVAPEWPKCIAASAAQLSMLEEELIRRTGGTPTLLAFRERSGDGVLFVQQRIDKDDGEKLYVPWTRWSNTHDWQQMEPDGLLPLYGLDRLKDGGTVFVHEGASVPARLQAKIDAFTSGALASDKEKLLRECPWLPQLCNAVHLGWPGGAPNPHRVDWSPLRDLARDRQVIVVCDNDQVGVNAAPKISRMLLRSMSAVRFKDRAFKEGFDLADSWPDKEEWWRGPRYTGPSLDEMLRPATWATIIEPKEGRGAPKIKIRSSFAKEWFYAHEPGVFVHRDFCDRLYSAEKFNDLVLPFSDCDNTARLLLRDYDTQADGLRYPPTQKAPRALRSATVDKVKGDEKVNTFRASDIFPVKGNPKPWLRFMRHLIPDPHDRHEVLRWCATLIARPEIKMEYAVLLISEMQGVGKTTLGEQILAPLMGRWNVSIIDEQTILNSNFNAWKAHKRLAICNEIYTGHRREAYDKLKSVITDKTIRVHRKYMEEYDVDNFVHLLACSNSMQALYLDPYDRRWLVPTVTEQKQPFKYWRDFHIWLNGGGLSIIAWWAEAFLMKHQPVRTGDPVPTTSRKEQVIAESRSEGSQIAFELGQLAMAAGPDEKIIFALDDVRRFVAAKRGIADMNDKRLEKPLTLKKALREGGMMEPERDPKVDKQGRRFTVAKGRFVPVIANFRITLDQDWPDLKCWHKRPHDLLEV